MPAHQVGVLAGHPHRVVDGDAVWPIEFRVVVPFQAAHHVGGDEGEHPTGRRLGDIFAEPGESEHRRAALVDQRCHARLHAHHVGVEPETAGDVTVHMGVRVDQAGQYELAANVDRPPCRSGQGLAYGNDTAITHRHVEEIVEVLGRVDDAAASQHEVVWGGLHEIHGGSPPERTTWIIIQRADPRSSPVWASD
jgi:hypothetical protein